MEQSNRAVDCDRPVKQEQALAGLPEAAREALRRRDVAITEAPVGEVGRGSDPDEALHSLGAKQRQVEGDPAAHR